MTLWRLKLFSAAEERGVTGLYGLPDVPRGSTSPPYINPDERKNASKETRWRRMEMTTAAIFSRSVSTVGESAVSTSSSFSFSSSLSSISR